MDVFVEYIVKRKMKGKDIALKVMLLLGTVFASLAVMFLVMAFIPGFMMIGFMLAAGVVVGGYYLSSNMNIEYEYIVTNGEIDVDKIISQRKRKRLLTVQVKSFEQFGPYDADKVSADNVGTTVVVTDNSDVGAYYAIFRHPKLGQTMLLFTPDSRVLEAIKPHLPRNIGRAM